MASERAGDSDAEREARWAERDRIKAEMETWFEEMRAKAKGQYVAVVAEALRDWQRNLGSPLAPTTLWIDKAETPAEVAVQALLDAGYVFARLGDRNG